MVDTPSSNSPDPTRSARTGRRLSTVSAATLLLGGLYMLVLSSRPPQVDLHWDTGSEADTAGFNLWRRDVTPEGTSDVGPELQVNENLIPAQGNSVEGASYRFVDDQVTSGWRYVYQIEELDRSGGRRRLPETIAVAVPDYRVLFLVEGLLAAALGLGLLWPARHRGQD